MLPQIRGPQCKPPPILQSLLLGTPKMVPLVWGRPQEASRKSHPSSSHDQEYDAFPRLPCKTITCSFACQQAECVASSSGFLCSRRQGPGGPCMPAESASKQRTKADLRSPAASHASGSTHRPSHELTRCITIKS